MKMPRPGKNDEPLDRRNKRRFTIELAVQYRVPAKNCPAQFCTGRTVNISSSGIWFTTEAPLCTNLPLELSVSWPARLNGVCPLKLVIFGTVVRSDEGGAALAIKRHEFRTRALWNHNSLPQQWGHTQKLWRDAEYTTKGFTN
jgi:hypothetical protein